MRVAGHEEGLHREYHNGDFHRGQHSSAEALPLPYGYTNARRYPHTPAVGEENNVAKGQASTRITRVSAFINDAVVDTLFTVLAICLVVVSVPAVVAQRWWGSVVLYSGLCRLLEILCVISLVTAVPIHDNTLRQRLLVIAREAGGCRGVCG